MSNFTNPTSILPNLTNLCPISVQTLSVITLNDPKMERTTGMSSEGPKLGEGRYGLTWNGRKTKKTGNPPWLPPPRSPARSRLVRRRLARLALLFLPGWLVRKGGGRNRLPQPKPDFPENGSKRPSSGSTVLGSFFYGFGA